MRYLFVLILMCSALNYSDATTYTVRDFGIDRDNLVTANSLNQSGNVTGQYSLQKKPNLQVIDFFWSAKSGLHIITTDGHPWRLPIVNNRDQVAGVASKQLYLYEPDKGLVLLGRPTGWDDLSVYAINDLGQILVGKYTRALKVTQFALWDQGHFTALELPGVPMGFNSSGDVLIGIQNDKNSSIYNLVTKETTVIGSNIASFEFNNQHHVVGFNPEKNNGFLWTPESGMTSFENFYPVHLNNLGHMTGLYKSATYSHFTKTDSQPGLWVDQQILDLNQMVDRDNSAVKDLEHIWNAFSINDKGQILVVATLAGGKYQTVLLLDPQEHTEKDFKQQAQEEWDQMSPELQAYYDYEIDRISAELNGRSQ